MAVQASFFPPTPRPRSRRYSAITGPELRAAREGLGISSDELARALGRAGRSVRSIEAQKASLRGTVRRYLDALRAIEQRRRQGFLEVITPLLLVVEGEEDARTK